jgi:hypothetical protein
MDQRSIALYLSINGLSTKAIHQELVRTLGAEAVAYPTVTWYLRTAKFPPKVKRHLTMPERHGLTQSTELS